MQPRMVNDRLHVEVAGTRIRVSKPRTNFTVTYQKRFANPQLMLKFIVGLREAFNSPAISEFRNRAFAAAVAKARELGCGTFKAGIANARGHPFRQDRCGELRSDRWPRDISLAAGKMDKKWVCSRDHGVTPP